VVCLFGSLCIWCKYRGEGEKAGGKAGEDHGAKKGHGHAHGNGEMHYADHGDKGPSESLVKNEH